MGPEAPGGNDRAECLQAANHRVDEWFGQFRRRGVGKAGPPAAFGIAIKRELAPFWWSCR